MKWGKAGIFLVGGVENGGVTRSEVLAVMDRGILIVKGM